MATFAQADKLINKQFEKQLKKYLKVVKSTGTKEIRALSLEALKLVMRKSPVNEGTFRGNWQVGLNNINMSIEEDITNNASYGRFDRKAFDRGNQVVGSLKSGDTVNVSNALPYANRLEYGWSDQAPIGMVRVTKIELTNWLKSRNKKV